jgi:hypothetical protein
LGGPYTEHRRIERVHFVGAIEPDIGDAVFDREADAIFRDTLSFYIGSRRIAIARTPGASFTPLKFCRQQSEWLWRDTPDPKLHALDVNLNESRVRPVSRGGKIGVEGVLPKPADL